MIHPSLSPIHHTVKVFDSEIHYWEYFPENTTTILMVHGFRGTHHGLERLIEGLQGYRVVVPDLPGFGDSPPMHAPHTISQYARAMQAFMRATQLERPMLLGHSMGSIVVADMVANDPHITPSVIFVNPIAARPMQGLGAVKIIPGVLYHWLAGRVLPEKIGMKILTNKYLFLLGSAAMTKTKDPELRKWIHWNHMEYMKRFSDRKSLFEAYTSSSTATIADYADAITHPVLMVAGQNDLIAPIKGQRLLAQALKAQLVELEDVGHIIHYEKPLEVAEAIKKFLNEV